MRFVCTGHQVIPSVASIIGRKPTRKRRGLLSPRRRGLVDCDGAFENCFRSCLTPRYLITCAFRMGCPTWSAQSIFGTGDKNAGAASLTPDALVASARLSEVVVAGDELALVDPQLTVEEMQLFY